MYLTKEEKDRLVQKWFHYFETLLYVWCLAHGITKPPRLEIEPDGGSYQCPGLIHLGYGDLQAKTAEEFFCQLQHLLGHEFQHLVSSTDKDWNAAHKLCFRNACMRLSVKVFGRTRRLTKDSDYEAFFRDLASKGVFVNQALLMKYVNFVLNVLEDGRIENIRARNHPGFGKYRKVFRGAAWLQEDFRDQDFFKEDPADLDSFGKLMMICGQLYPLATLGIYQYGFLAAYGGSDAHDLVASFIPEISAAVLGKTCKDCMDHGRNIFDRLLDLVLDVCTIEADAKAFEKFLEQLLEKLIDDIEKTQMSASPSTEEKGDGLPAESPLGASELTMEVDKETFEQYQEEQEAGDEVMSVKLTCKEVEEAEEAENGEASQQNSEGADSSEAEATQDSSSSSDGTSPAEQSSEGGNIGNEEESSSGDPDHGEKAGEASGENDGGEQSSSDGESHANDSLGHRNKVDSSAESNLSEEDFLEKIEAAMKEAAKEAATDFQFAEADAEADEKFREAAQKLSPVTPAEISLGDVNGKYSYNVNFNEVTRKYKPVKRLPFELENWGQSLGRKVEQLLKNKQEPDRRFLTSGQIDIKRLPDAAMGFPDIFMKKGQPVTTDVAAFLLMDNSGSMGNGPGSTRFACCNAFAVVEEAFKGLMPLKIAAFDAEDNRYVNHEVIKEFDEVAPANLSFNFRDLGRGGWGNKDGYSIRVAASQLAQRPEKDKILIIASDGFPTDYDGGYEEGIADVKSAVDDARKAGIRTIGMYMYHDQNDSDFATYREMYGKDIIFSSLDEIGDHLIPLLQGYFR